MTASLRYLILVLAGALAALVAPMLVLGGGLVGLLAGLAGLACYLVLAEICFRAAYRWKTGGLPQRFQRIPADQLHVEPHPFLPYAYRRDFTPAKALRRSDTVDSPLHPDRFRHDEPSFNNYRLKRDPADAPDIRTPKPEGTVRVLCLGASTTANSIREDGATYSYPSELGKTLATRHPGTAFEVVNGGMGGRTSADLLVHFLLELVDMAPDAVVLYHAYNDLGPSLTPGFRSDYSHARRNIGEVYHLYRLRSLFPDLPSALYNYFLNSFFPGDLSISLIAAVSTGQPDPKGDFQGLETYKRNLGHILDVCRARGIRVLCSSYCHYHWPELSQSPVHQKYAQGLAQENQAMREIAEERGIRFVDTAAIMPQDPALFVDSVHFTPEGMKRLAEILADGLDPLLDPLLDDMADNPTGPAAR